MLVCVSGDEIRNITAEEAAFEAALKADFCVPGAFSLHSSGVAETITLGF